MPELNSDAGATNPSQTGGPGITLGAPVAGTATPPVVPAGEVAEPLKTEAEPVRTDPPTAEQVASEQPKVEVVPSTTDAAGAVIYDETGDAGLDMALSFIGRLGIPGTDPAMVAAANGDFSFIEAKLATLGDEAKGWEQHIALGKQAFQRQLETFKATQSKTLAAVHQVAGGEAEWNALVQWAGTVATPEEKAALNAMFDAGPIQAQMAARSLAAAHAEAKGTTVKPANPASAASGVAPAAPQALTAANYHKDVDALFKQMGNRMDTSPEYAALRARYFGR